MINPKISRKRILFVLLFSFSFLTLCTRNVFAELNLQEQGNSYIIENDYYRAIIPKKNSDEAHGIIKHLYIKKADGFWSNDIVYQGSKFYGLGYLEGGNDSGNNTNSSFGLQNTVGIEITITKNTSSEIEILSHFRNKYTDFSETWSFYADKPYFQSISKASNNSSILANQFQFAWMINSQLPVNWYGTDSKGNIQQYTEREFQPINSPNLNIYPWLNWQFPNENISLGLIFTDLHNKYATIGETGDFPFEYQLDFDLGSGSLGSPTSAESLREVTTIYFTNANASNDPINSFAQKTYQEKRKYLTFNPETLAAAHTYNSYGQNLGISSALVNSPYFLVRQNSQNMVNHEREGGNSLTSIYAPLYKSWEPIQDNLYDFADQIQYSINYSDKQTYPYGDIVSAESVNSEDEVYLINNAFSKDKKLAYITKFLTWANSDKLEILGQIKNATKEVTLANIYVSLKIPLAFQSNCTLISLGNNIYDIQFQDEIYGELGIAIKVNSLTKDIILQKDELLIYVYKEDSSDTYSKIDSTFDLIVYPHKGWFKSYTEFSGLHSQEILSYYKRISPATQKIKTQVLNNITSTGEVRYTLTEVDNPPSVTLFAQPKVDEINIHINKWGNSFPENKVWTERSYCDNVIAYTIGDLSKNFMYIVYMNGKPIQTLTADSQGMIYFLSRSNGEINTFSITPKLSFSNGIRVLQDIKEADFNIDWEALFDYFLLQAGFSPKLSQ